MIPIKLSISGFLSYRDPIELDFASFDLACISGENGAGKSSLLDAITWALFGQARKKDDSIINLQSNTAEVALVFYYEGNTYRVTRILPKGKTTRLEFQIQEPEGSKWKVLTGETVRNTQETIEHTLRLDYETFVNASFFLQGKADQFTQQKPPDRKRILGSILGLEVWETYRQRVNDRRRAAEAEIQNLDGRMQEIKTELDEEQARIERLEALQAELKHLTKARSAQEKLLQQARKVEASLIEQRKLIDTLAVQVQASERRQINLENRLASRGKEKEAYTNLVAQAEEIESAYTTWQAKRTELERWDEVARQFREHDSRRQAPRMEIEREKTRLEEQIDSLRAQQKELEVQLSSRQTLELQISEARATLRRVEADLEKKDELDGELLAARQRQYEADKENPRLKAEMDEMDERRKQLSQVEGATCPLCGQPLNEHDRQQLIDEINAQGKVLGDRFRDNSAFLKEADRKVSELEAQIKTLDRANGIRLTQSQLIARLDGQLEAIQQKSGEWDQKGAARMAEIEQVLETGQFSSDARSLLAKIDDELKAIGYDAAAHDACRQEEARMRSAEGEQRELEKARAALAPLLREIEEAEQELSKLTGEVRQQQQKHDEAAARLAAAQAEAPDIDQVERDFTSLFEQEKGKEREVGVAQSRVSILKVQKDRLQEFAAQREDQARLVSQYKLLDRAFGKDGVPALLIEQALPEIEMRANELLERLSGGNMSVRFATQAAFKDKKREDLKETLDILISDGSGTRDYELYSGGEAFRVNFAIRLALSELLAKRAGARLQTLVVDEGFGSQDAQGRQHLIEAINMVRQDFAKVVVISHLDELKDAFPNRIEVEKTERGSTLRVV